MAANGKYSYSNLNFGRKVLICPKCLESLVQPDIEFFSACPYCNHKFEMDNEFEDFILEPVVDQWIRNMHDSRGGEDFDYPCQ